MSAKANPTSQFSNHPEEPSPLELKYDPNDPWLLMAGAYWAKMTPEEVLADWLRNEGSQTEEWPDFGVR
jgi:hypothetical protein